MGLTTSEIAVSTIPCCCDNDRDRGIDDFGAGYSEIPPVNNDDPGIDDVKFDDDDKASTYDDDDFMQDPDNYNTINVMKNININLLNYDDGDLWNVLDQIFESYQPQTLIEQIQDASNGLKEGLDRLLDEFTKNSLYQSVINTLEHRNRYKFDIRQTMAIVNYPKKNYKTQPLWFYGMFSSQNRIYILYLIK